MSLLKKSGDEHEINDALARQHVAVVATLMRGAVELFFNLATIL